MRDEHGRYSALKEISANGPSWARGCEKCKQGIVAAPELTRTADLYLERLVQAVDGDITFCECQAGQRYRVSLANRYRQLVEEARKDSRMTTFAQAKTHPDIEAVRRAMQAAAELTKAPPIHYDAPVAEPEAA